MTAQVVIDRDAMLHLDPTHRRSQGTVLLTLDDLTGFTAPLCQQCLTLFTPALSPTTPVSSRWISWALPLADAMTHGSFGMPPYLMESVMWRAFLYAPDRSAATSQLLTQALAAVPHYPGRVPLQLVTFRTSPVTDLSGDWCALSGSRKDRHATDTMIAQAHMVRGASSGFLIDLEPEAGIPARRFAAALPEPCLPWLNPAGFTDVTVVGPVEHLGAARLLAEQSVNREDGGRWLLQAAVHMC